MCEICQNWARAGGPVASMLTNHHPNCPHFNDSLMDVWKVSDGSTSYITDSEQEARECAQNDTEQGVENLTVTKEKMHREVFENLPEFEGY